MKYAAFLLFENSAFLIYFLSAEYFWAKENIKFLMPFSWFKLIFYVCIQKSWLIEGQWHFSHSFSGMCYMQSKGYFSNVWWRVPKKVTFPSVIYSHHCSEALCPHWEGKVPQPLIITIQVIISTFFFRCKHPPLCAWKPLRKKQTRGTFLSLVLYLCWAHFQEHRKPEIRVKLLIKKGPEWFLLHLITTSLSLDESTVLDSTADNSGEVEVVFS